MTAFTAKPIQHTPVSTKWDLKFTRTQQWSVPTSPAHPPSYTTHLLGRWSELSVLAHRHRGWWDQTTEKSNILGAETHVVAKKCEAISHTINLCLTYWHLGDQVVMLNSYNLQLHWKDWYLEEFLCNCLLAIRWEPHWRLVNISTENSLVNIT